MGTKTMIKWPKQITVTLVEQLIRAEKDLQKAIVIFDAATGEYTNGFQHDHSTFGVMISRFVSANQFRAAEDLLNRMKNEKCSITEDIFLSICRGYGRVHRPLEAIRIFQKMKECECQPTQKSYITVFAILVGENQLKMALRFYRYMREMAQYGEEVLKGQVPPPNAGGPGGHGGATFFQTGDGPTVFRFNPRNANDIFAEFFWNSSPFGGMGGVGGMRGGSRFGGGGGGMFGDDIFTSFGDGRMMSSAPWKAALIESTLPCSLEELYKGTTRR
ncbi:Pentatricopeptide repeat-containing protein [Camellia lanceoleosa]|uniref:Pentatricopeptide repeat-containing protein n=1 Tax=Camellia lanceoleosa TaxID=1840588 RepID=A0ACC0GHH1_9ERIC|nr:Pentatricopeptide repeat-containing protein [Camellia lanceoleosa]